MKIFFVLAITLILVLGCCSSQKKTQIQSKPTIVTLSKDTLKIVSIPKTDTTKTTLKTDSTKSIKK